MPLSPATWLFLATAAWGISFPLTQAVGLLQARLVPEAGTVFHSASLLGVRFLLAGLLLLPWVLREVRKAGPTRGEFVQGGWLGFTAGAGLLLQTDGLQYTSSSTSSFLTQAYVVLLPLWAVFRTRKAPAKSLWLALALVFAGLTLLSGVTPDKLHLGRGELETLLATILFAAQILILEAPSHRGNRPLLITVIMFAVMGFGCLGSALALAPKAGDLWTVWTSSGAWALTCFLSLVCTIFSFSVMNRWQPQVDSARAGLIYATEPVHTAVWVLFLPALLGRWLDLPMVNETLTTPLVVGGALILLGNALTMRKTASGPNQA